ncbi:MAG: hypothetical protein IT301_10260 [Dehalococcoidia bacterium]|nr:hypothetical protein [Dehalococcoidia bacterium]
MRRFVLAATPLALLVLTSACGDGPDKTDQPTATVEATATLNSGEQPQVPDKELPSPTPIPDTLPVIQVAFGGKVYAPTRTEFSALAKTKVTAGGKEYEGVTLAALADQAGAKTGAVATIRGTRADNLRLGAVRFPVADIGASTVFIVDDSGHVTLFSSSIPQEQWLKDVTAIALN